MDYIGYLYSLQYEFTNFAEFNKKKFLIIKFMLKISYMLDCYCTNGIIILFGGIHLEKR